MQAKGAGSGQPAQIGMVEAVSRLQGDNDDVRLSMTMFGSV